MVTYLFGYTKPNFKVKRNEGKTTPTPVVLIKKFKS